MNAPAEISEILGLAPVARQTPVGWIDSVQAGLPLEALSRVAHHVAPTDANFAFRIVPRATLARRRKGPAGTNRLSPEESAKVARLASVWTLARSVWGSDKGARDFLSRPHPLLDGQTPLDVVLRSEFGGSLVEEILQGLRYGTAV